MRLGLLTACWRRPSLTQVVLDYYAQLELQGIDLVRVAVISPGDPEPFELVDGWLYNGADNSPLGAKWNVGMRAMREQDVDAVVIAGSDDLLNVRYFEHVAQLVEGGRDFIELQGLHFYHVNTGRCVYAESKRVGAGRCLSRKLLDEADWQPWEDDVNRNLDGSMYRTFGLPGVAVRKIHLRPPEPICEKTLVDSKVAGIVCVDLKSENPDGSCANIWSYAQMEERLKCEEVDGAALLKSEFPTVELS